MWPFGGPLTSPSLGGSQAGLCLPCQVLPALTVVVVIFALTVLLWLLRRAVVADPAAIKGLQAVGLDGLDQAWAPSNRLPDLPAVAPQYTAADTFGVGLKRRAIRLPAGRIVAAASLPHRIQVPLAPYLPPIAAVAVLGLC